MIEHERLQLDWGAIDESPELVACSSVLGSVFDDMVQRLEDGPVELGDPIGRSCLYPLDRYQLRAERDGPHSILINLGRIKENTDTDDSPSVSSAPLARILKVAGSDQQADHVVAMTATRNSIGMSLSDINPDEPLVDVTQEHPHTDNVLVRENVARHLVSLIENDPDAAPSTDVAAGLRFEHVIEHTRMSRSNMITYLHRKQVITDLPTQPELTASHGIGFADAEDYIDSELHQEATRAIANWRIRQPAEKPPRILPDIAHDSPLQFFAEVLDTPLQLKPTGYPHFGQRYTFDISGNTEEVTQLITHVRAWQDSLIDSLNKPHNNFYQQRTLDQLTELYQVVDDWVSHQKNSEHSAIKGFDMGTVDLPLHIDQHLLQVFRGVHLHHTKVTVKAPGSYGVFNGYRSASALRPLAQSMQPCAVSNTLVIGAAKAYEDADTTNTAAIAVDRAYSGFDADTQKGVAIACEDVFIDRSATALPVDCVDIACENAQTNNLLFKRTEPVSTPFFRLNYTDLPPVLRWYARQIDSLRRDVNPVAAQLRAFRERIRIQPLPPPDPRPDGRTIANWHETYAQTDKHAKLGRMLQFIAFFAHGMLSENEYKAGLDHFSLPEVLELPEYLQQLQPNQWNLVRATMPHPYEQGVDSTLAVHLWAHDDGPNNQARTVSPTVAALRFAPTPGLEVGLRPHTDSFLFHPPDQEFTYQSWISGSYNSTDPNIMAMLLRIKDNSEYYGQRSQDALKSGAAEIHSTNAGNYEGLETIMDFVASTLRGGSTLLW